MRPLRGTDRPFARTPRLCRSTPGQHFEPYSFPRLPALRARRHAYARLRARY
jgi:hypothetical protein